MWNRITRYPVVPLILLVAVVILPALFAEQIAPHGPFESSSIDRLKPPAFVDGGSWQYPLGTDRLGRCVFSRIIYGSRYVVGISVVSIVFGALVGTALGLLAGYFRGWTEIVVMRAVDIRFALPSVLVGLAAASIWAPSFATVIGIIVFVIWSFFARQVRAEVLSIRERDFVQKARVAGAGHLRIMLVHILPNITNTIIVMATLQLGVTIILESTLSFLGIGIPRPIPAWGLLVADGRQLVVAAWWISFFPGLAILLVVLSINLFGDWLRNRLDPRLQNVG